MSCTSPETPRAPADGAASAAGPLPTTLRHGIPEAMVGDLRSDQAGETGAVRIYQGILAMSRNTRVRHFAEHHLATERRHLALINAVLPRPLRSRLLPLWSFLGFVTGLVPALLGPRAVFTTIEAVETFVDEHYQAQVDRIDGLLARTDDVSRRADLAALRALVVRCQADEVAHRNDAARHLAGQATPGWLRLWCRAIAAGSTIAVRFARAL